MITDFELRVLCELSYIDELAEEFKLGTFQQISTLHKTSKKLIRRMPLNKRAEAETVIQNWIILETYENANNTGINSKLDAYLFCNINKEYVITYRGTNPIALKQFWYDMKENLKTFFPAQVGNKKTQFWQSVAFTSGCINTFKIPENNLILTGHSKGGALASKVAYFIALAMNKTIITRTFAPARIELSFVHYQDKPVPRIECQNYLVSGDRVTGGLTRIRFTIFWLMFNAYKLRGKKVNHLSKKGFFILWQMWILKPYIGNGKVYKPIRKSLLRHSLRIFDDHFDSNGMLK